MIDTGTVGDTASLESWIADVLDHGAGRSDALFLAAAYRAPSAADLARIDALARAFAPTRERLQETDLQGAAFGATVGAIWGGDLGGLTYPVAVGGAAAREGLPLDATSAVFLQAFVANLVSVGMRLIPLGQTEGQATIRRLAPLCLRIAREARDGDLDRLSSTVFRADIASARHETQHTRIFRT